MKALLCRELGTRELVVSEVTAPVAGQGQVVIDVKAAAANFPDVLMLEGKYQFKPPMPFAPGCELAGGFAVLGTDDGEHLAGLLATTAHLDEGADD